MLIEAFTQRNSNCMGNEKNDSYKLSIAPMMDCTDKHFRMIMRQITKKALLYTEMIAAQSIYYSANASKLLSFHEAEHPIALQIGGENLKILKKASIMAEEWGYDEINLNIGCPSPRVKAGNFGASLMKSPEKVAKCIEILNNTSSLPITVKHRIGVDNYDSFEFLEDFVLKCAEAGAKRFIIHARKAILKGLNPKQNRTIPPLRYDLVQKLKHNNPELIIEINGGFKDIESCINYLKIFNGVMVGRSAYNHPMNWQRIDEMIFGCPKISLKPSDVIDKMIPYCDNYLLQGGRLWDIGKHFLKLVEGIPGAKIWRNDLSQKLQNNMNNIEIIENSKNKLKDNGY
tara:strand:+ start:3771 stop:4802 length:1032 start_codon:yes stop_codon:yes gene_type:complete